MNLTPKGKDQGQEQKLPMKKKQKPLDTTSRLIEAPAFFACRIRFSFCLFLQPLKPAIFLLRLRHD